MYHAYGEDGKVANRDEVQEAYNLLNEINGYSLTDRYADNFTYDTQEGSNEIVFSIKYLVRIIIRILTVYMVTMLRFALSQI